MTMTMTEAANRLKVLAEAYHGNTLEQLEDDEFLRPDDEGYVISRNELEAVTTAAAILGMFVEALEDTTT